MKNTIVKKIISAFLFSFIAAFFLVGIGYTQTTNPPNISGDKVVLGQSFILIEDQILDGDLAIVGGTALLEKNSQVNGDIAVIGGHLVINGTVHGDIQAIGGSLNLGETARVDGSLYDFGGTLTQYDGAVILGQQIANLPFNFHLGNDNSAQPNIPNIPVTKTSPFIKFIGGFLLSILQIFSLSALALILVLIAPKSTERISNAIIKQPFVHWGIGLLTVLVLPIVLILLVITLILSPLAVIGILVFGIVLIYGWINLGNAIGKRLFVNKSSSMSPALVAAIGTLILSSIARISALVPCIGGFLVGLVSLCGLGAIILTRFGTREYSISSPARATTTRTNLGSGVILAENDDDLNVDIDKEISENEGESLENGG